MNARVDIHDEGPAVTNGRFWATSHDVNWSGIADTREELDALISEGIPFAADTDDVTIVINEPPLAA